MRDATDDVRRALDALNAAWRERHFADLAACFDEQIVMGAQWIAVERIMLY